MDMYWPLSASVFLKEKKKDTIPIKEAKFMKRSPRAVPDTKSYSFTAKQFSILGETAQVYCLKFHV